MLKNLKTKDLLNVKSMLIFAITFSVGAFFVFLWNKNKSYTVDPNIVKPISQKVKDFEKSKCDFNPLMLKIFVNQYREIDYNGESMGSLENLSKLEKNIKEKFQEREINGVLRNGTDEVIKEMIIFPQYKSRNIDLNGLIEMLDNAGANPILIDWNHYSENTGVVYGGKTPCSFFDRQELKFEETNFTR